MSNTAHKLFPALRLVHPQGDLLDAHDNRNRTVQGLCDGLSERDVLSLLLTQGKLTPDDIQAAVDFGKIVYGF